MKTIPPERSRTSLVLQLGRYRWLHRLVAVLRVVPITDLLLRRFPLQRRLKPSNLVYRITSFDQLSIEAGLFKREEYAPVLDGRATETFIDLGCNSGWFALWLSARSPDSGRRGLLIDANPRMVREAAWHMRRNGLNDWLVAYGAVGLPPGQTSTTFYLHPSTSASSVLPYQAGKQLPVKGKITDVTVPAISVATEWTRRFGDVAVDLLKLDIEGKELDFVAYESAFLKQRVRRIALEWHKWWVSLAQLDTQLESIRFERRGVYEENELVGFAIYENLDEIG